MICDDGKVNKHTCWKQKARYSSRFLPPPRPPPLFTRIQVKLILEKADKDGDALVDLEEFLDFVRMMRTGDPHQGPLKPKVLQDESIVSKVVFCKVYRLNYGYVQGVGEMIYR